MVERGEGAGSPLLFPETVYNAPASHIAARLGLQGEVLTLVGDAATGVTAVRTGCELLATGEADYCLVTAAQEIDWITCEAYSRWGLIRDDSSQSSVFSEGAAAIVLAREPGIVESPRHIPAFPARLKRIPKSASTAVLAEILPGSQVILSVVLRVGNPPGYRREELP